MDIKNLFARLSQSKASDLLLVPGYTPYLRVINSLYKEGNKILEDSDIEELLCPLASKDGWAEFKKTKELDFAYEDNNGRYRINLHYQRGKMAATIRSIPKEIPSIEQLGLPKIIKTLSTLERGLVLVTGPTGCGKSTTQAAMINEINATRQAHIVTIEDPIEFVHPAKMSVIEQREVGIDTDSFNEALKRVLRQIPNVILVGEMRDFESIQMAITAAETGHLVISTLHTQDAAQSLDRMIDVFPPHQQGQIRTMLSLTLQAIIAQQLIPKKDGKGLALAMEIMIATPAIRNIIRKGNTQDIYSMIELGSQTEMQTMDSSLKALVNNGIIDKNEAFARTMHREQMEKILSGAA